MWVMVTNQQREAERASGCRNIATANFIRSFGNTSDDAVLDFYFLQCSLTINCVDLARSVQYLAGTATAASQGGGCSARSGRRGSTR